MGEKRKGRGGKGRDDDDEEGGGWKPGGQKQYKGGHSVGTGAQPFPKATPRARAVLPRCQASSHSVGAPLLAHIPWGHRCCCRGFRRRPLLPLPAAAAAHRLPPLLAVPSGM